MLILGVLQHRLALLGHDAAHVRFTPSTLVNRITAESIGFPLFIPVFGGYRKSHFEHHSNLGTHDDPEHAYRDGWGYSLSWPKLISTFVGDLFALGWLSQFRFVRDTFPSSWTIRIQLLSFWLVLIAVAVACQVQYALGIWLAALVTSFWAVFRVRAYFEHVDVPLDGKHTSHRFVTSPVIRAIFFPHNTWCHYEHHLFPSVPFYNLPKLRTLLKQPEYKEIQSINAILS